MLCYILGGYLVATTLSYVKINKLLKFIFFLKIWYCTCPQCIIILFVCLLVSWTNNLLS